MEYTEITAGITTSRVALGTWAIGGWLWGGTDKREAEATVRTAIEEHGITLIDTAPVYGFGQSETIVGQAVRNYGQRDKVCIATKAGLNWTESEKVYRDSRPERIRQEVEDSLRRLQTDYIDLYQVHWPDKHVPLEATAAIMQRLYEAGKIRAIGVSNFSTQQMDVFRQVAPLHTAQPPYNLFERDAEKEILPYCRKHNLKALTYGALCRGMLTGKITADYTPPKGDIRKADPKFRSPRLPEYVATVEALAQYAEKRYQKNIIQFAVRWVLDRADHLIPLWGARHPGQLAPVSGLFDFSLTEQDYRETGRLIAKYISQPVGPEFMAPPE